MDCSKSAELYEQSSEQLLEEERRRAESRKSRLEYQQSIESGGQQDYYDVQSLSYDGKQNGRIKPYEEPPQENNQVQSNRERIKSSRYFDPGNSFNSQESNSQRDSDQTSFAVNGIQPKQQQLNQFASRNTDEGNRHSTTSQQSDYYSTPKKAQNYHVTNRNSNSQRDDKGALKRLKFKGLNRGSNFTSQRVTPAYTESTTFRGGNTSPVKESQQFAESAAFVSNRGNRFNENTGNTHQYYYQLYINRDPTTRSPAYDSTTTSWRRGNENDVSTQRNDYSFFTDTGSTYYETTTQYSTATATPEACNDEVTTENSLSNPTSTYVDAQPTTESLLFADSNYEYRGSLRTTGANVRSSFVNKSYYNSNNNRESSRATVASSTGTIPPTTRSYVTTDAYRQNTITPSSSQQRYTTSYVSGTPTASFRSNSFGRSTEKPTTRATIDSQSNRFDAKLISKSPTTVSPGYRQNSISTIDSGQSNRLNVDAKLTSKNPTTASPAVYRQNSISTTTEKPSRSTAAYQQNTVTEKDLSPYDRSFTYKQGKVMSTLGPYVPFTKNYAQHTSSSGTSKPTPYTATVPTYTTSYTSSGTRTLTPKLKYPTPSSLSKIKSRVSEREHALSMLHSLKSLEHSVPSLSDVLRGTERVSNASAPPAASTLHSLALYFSTATENFDSNETTDSSISVESAEDVEKSQLSKKSNGTVHVPTSILTRHTIDSYAELFKLNNDDVETNNNVTTEDRSDNSNREDDSLEDDLELQQSGGSLDDLRKSNSTRLRELAQVFTHALSAYLLDPDSFKRVLTEIRPTEPSKTTEESGDSWKTTTPYPTTGDDEENTSSTKEKDEVLDFSDDGNDVRQKLTTVYPTTFEPPTTTVQESVYDTLSTLPSTYYVTTPRASSQDAFEYSTNPVTNSEISEPPTETTFTLEPNSTPYASFYSQNNNEVEKGSVESTVTNDPLFEFDIGNQSRVGGFQNNSVATVAEPVEKLLVTTPISDNYVVSPTPFSPSIFVHMATNNWNKKSTSRKPEQQLTPPFFDSHSETVRKASSSRVTPESYSSTPMSTTLEQEQPHKIPRHKLLAESKLPHSELKSGFSLPTLRSSYMKFRDLYNRITNEKPATTTATVTESTTTNSVGDTTPCAEDDDSSGSVDQREDSKVLNNDHWTSSPAVTRLWETSVFVDPQRINHDLESDLGPSTVTTGTFGRTPDSGEREEYENTPSLGEDVSSSSEETFVSEEDAPFSSQRLSRDKDSPTTFSLLPTSFSTSTVENTVTPKPLITTRSSSITTTITSSITSSTNSLPRDILGYTSLLPYTGATSKSKSNGTENEIAERLFGKLNASSTDALMRVMKQVDKNETVRQLVLLLIRHCRDPTNKTLQREREELLNALLRLPVNEFSSEESRNAVAGINQLGLSTVESSNRARSVSSSTPSTPLVTDPPVTTFRSRKSRRFRTTTENSASIVRRSEKTATSTDENNHSQGDEATSASDNRALELLRSLYTIATKWG